MNEGILWAITGISLIGTAANMLQKRWGFYFWAVANFVWVFYDLDIGAYQQAFLMAIYFVMAIVGLFTWKKGDVKNGKD